MESETPFLDRCLGDTRSISEFDNPGRHLGELRRGDDNSGVFGFASEFPNATSSLSMGRRTKSSEAFLSERGGPTGTSSEAGNQSTTEIPLFVEGMVCVDASSVVFCSADKCFKPP